MSEKKKKIEAYALKIILQINRMFNEDCENHIDMDEFKKDDNFNLFIHALSNVAPTFILTQYSDETPDVLAANYIANKMIFLYTDREDKNPKLNTDDKA